MKEGLLSTDIEGIGCIVARVKEDFPGLVDRIRLEERMVEPVVKDRNKEDLQVRTLLCRCREWAGWMQKQWQTCQHNSSQWLGRRQGLLPGLHRLLWTGRGREQTSRHKPIA